MNVPKNLKKFSHAILYCKICKYIQYKYNIYHTVYIIYVPMMNIISYLDPYNKILVTH